jgi:hypothetical protein
LGIEIDIVKVEVIAEMIGKKCLIPVNEQGYEEIKAIPLGEVQKGIIEEIKDSLKRSNTQLGLYWAACKEIAENANELMQDYKSWNTKDKVDEQIKIECKHYDFYVWYMNKITGEKTLHIKTKSIAFKNLKHLDACGYFTEAFLIMAHRMKMTVDDFIEHVQSKMGKDFVCKSCGKVFLNNERQRHHIFSKTEITKKVYFDFIDHPENIQEVCAGCNTSHAGQAKKEGQVGLLRFTEKEFCDHFGIEVRTGRTEDKINSMFGEGHE